MEAGREEEIAASFGLNIKVYLGEVGAGL